MGILADCITAKCKYLNFKPDSPLIVLYFTAPTRCCPVGLGENDKSSPETEEVLQVDKTES